MRANRRLRTTIGAQHGLSGGLRPRWWTRFIKGCIALVMVADGPARPPRAVESPALPSSASVVAACCDVESSIANKIQRPEGALHVICHVESSVTEIERSAESSSHPHKSIDASTATIHANTANNNDPAPFSISPLLMPTAGFHGGRRNHHLGSSAGSHHGVLNRPSDAQAGEAPVSHVANHHSTTTTTSTPSMAHKPTTTSKPPGLLFKLPLLLPESSAPSSPPPSPPSSTCSSSPSESQQSDTEPSLSQQSDTDTSAIEESSASSNEHSTERSATSLHESDASSPAGASDGEHVPEADTQRAAMAGTAQPAATHADAWLDNDDDDRLRLHRRVTAQQYLHLNDRCVRLRRQQIADHALISQLRNQIARLQQTQRQLERICVRQRPHCHADSSAVAALAVTRMQAAWRGYLTRRSRGILVRSAGMNAQLLVRRALRVRSALRRYQYFEDRRVLERAFPTVEVPTPVSATPQPETGGGAFAATAANGILHCMKAGYISADPALVLAQPAVQQQLRDVGLQPLSARTRQPSTCHSNNAARNVGDDLPHPAPGTRLLHEKLREKGLANLCDVTVQVDVHSLQDLEHIDMFDLLFRLAQVGVNIDDAHIRKLRSLGVRLNKAAQAQRSTQHQLISELAAREQLHSFPKQWVDNLFRRREVDAAIRLEHASRIRNRHRRKQSKAPDSGPPGTHMRPFDAFIPPGAKPGDVVTVAVTKPNFGLPGHGDRTSIKTIVVPKDHIPGSRKPCQVLLPVRFQPTRRGH